MFSPTNNPTLCIKPNTRIRLLIGLDLFFTWIEYVQTQLKIVHFLVPIEVIRAEAHLSLAHDPSVHETVRMF